MNLRTNFLFRFDAPPYPVEIIVSVDQPIGDAMRVINRLELTPKQRAKMDFKKHPGWLCAHAHGMDRVIIFIPERPCMNADWIACMQHECFHATEFVFHHIGAYLDHGSSEPFAYLQSYIFEKILVRTLCRK